MNAPDKVSIRLERIDRQPLEDHYSSRNDDYKFQCAVVFRVTDHNTNMFVPVVLDRRMYRDVDLVPAAYRIAATLFADLASISDKFLRIPEVQKLRPDGSMSPNAIWYQELSPQ